MNTAQAHTAEALPCPFCGKPPGIWHITPTQRMHRCVDCLIDYKTPEDWNTRAGYSAEDIASATEEDRTPIMRALSGIADPAEALKEAREALEESLHEYTGMDETQISRKFGMSRVVRVRKVRAAILALNPAQG